MPSAPRRRLRQTVSAVTAARSPAAAEPPVTTGNPELVPSGYDQLSSLLRSSWAYEHIRWMVQKDALGQDMFLIGSHSPLRRWLAFRFCEAVGRECEFVSLTSDTSEADLKARRELRVGGAPAGDQHPGVSVVWLDQAVVRAAIHGRVLVLEGLEKAERNVLPVLNNLLENREMQLEDGRFLVAPKRYDKLMEEFEEYGSFDTERKSLKLVRVHERFRVIAIGVPAPPFPGNPLDPPLRSRFQARHCGRAPTEALLVALRMQYAPSVPRRVVERLVALYEAIWALGEAKAGTAGVESRAVAFSSLCYPCEQALISAARLLEHVPQLTCEDVLHRIFPWQPGSGLLQGEAAALVAEVMARASAESEQTNIELLLSSARRGHQEGKVELDFAVGSKAPSVAELQCHGGKLEPRMPASSLQRFQLQLLSGMLQSAAIGHAVCLIGPRGEGKTFLARQFALSMGYGTAETLFLFEDMTARDLFQRRSTNNRGESMWEPSPLVHAMEIGQLCVLDGLQRLPAGTIAALVQLIQDREVTLYDGKRFISSGRWNHLTSVLGMSDQDLTERGLHRIHPAFRVLGLAAPPETGSRCWLSNEVMQMFHFFVLPRQESPASLVSHAVPGCPAAVVRQLAAVRQLLQEAAADPGSPLWAGVTTAQRGSARGSGQGRTTAEVEMHTQPQDEAAVNPTVTLSLRQMLRLARRAASAPAGTDLANDMGIAVESALLAEFMPRVERAEVRSVLKKAGLDLEPRSTRVASAHAMAILAADLSTRQPVLRVGDLEITVRHPARPALVPYTEFYDIPQHKLVIREMLRDWLIGEHMLLIGNQGVGKNKLTDRVLMLLHREREYVQLHRDTTVGSLTLAPSLRDGVVVYDDSPLVKAMIHGRVLVVDEFDKAPTEVVVVLKALLEDGEILLADGRRFFRERRQELPIVGGSTPAGPRACPIHPDFLVVALANRPGFPFLGNDFFRELGDCFACHAVRNPDQASEIALLQSYAPVVPLPLLQALTAAFRELRELVDAGRLAYPYSTRELVNIVRHLAKYPGDPLGSILENVFAFDVYDAQLRDMVAKVFQRQGLPFGAGAGASAGDADGYAGSALAGVQALQPPEAVARLWRQQRAEGAPPTANVDLQFMEAPAYLPDICWRSVSPEDAEEVGGVDEAELEGQAGAEWAPLDLRSARAERFCQEELWWRIGCVTKEGVIIKGTDPLMGSWLGDMLAMATAQGCLCVLTSQMSLFVYDTDKRKARELPLAIGKTLRNRSTYAAGHAMLSAREGIEDCLAMYDSNNQVLVRVWPRDGRISTISVPLPEGRGPVMCAGMLADLPIAVLYAIGGCELVLIACGPRAGRNIFARISCRIPNSKIKLRQVRILSRTKILLTCEDQIEFHGRSQIVELSLSSKEECNAVGGNGTGAEFLSSLHAGDLLLVYTELASPGQGVQHWRHCSRPLLSSELPLPRHFAEVKLELGKQLLAHVASNDETLAMFAAGLDAAEGQPGATIMGYRRAQAPLAEVAAAVGASEADDADLASSTGTMATCWHDATKSLVTAIADSSPSALNVRHGAVLLEVVDVLHAQIRRILLSKVPGLGVEGIGRKGAGTGGTLAEQGLMMTAMPGQKTMARPHEMAACIACCETSDGRLALLFSDAHVRILELRQDTLAVQGALYQGLLGKGARSGDLESALEGDTWDEDGADEEVELDDESTEDTRAHQNAVQGRGRGGRGRGSGRGGKGRGKGGRGHDGERELRRQAKESATEALRDARELASKAAASQRAALDLDSLDEGKYNELFAAVENEITQLRVVLQAVEAKERERVWLRGKTTGELDDMKLVDLAIGERTVYKRRGQREEARAAQRLPKRLSFVVDVSGSMAYFNGDQRLDRLCATVVMLMEGLAGLEHKYQYEIVGHSGETHWLPFVQMGQAPRSRAERLAVVQAMVDHSSRARSGDHTLAASVQAVREITAESADDYFVFLVSDANLRGYGVRPEDLAAVLMGDKRVNAYAVFIAEPAIAEELKAQMPAGRAHLVMDTTGMPLLFKDIFSRALVNGDAKSRL